MKSRDLTALAVLAGAWSSPAFAEEFRVAVSCPAWSSEQVSQVEARIRAAVLLEQTPPDEVRVSCQDEAVQVEVRSGVGSAERPVERTTPLLEDDIVREVDVALRELRRPAPTPPPPVTAPAPVPPAPVPAPAVVVPPPVVMAPKPSWLELRGSGVVERWSKHAALGVELAPSLGDERLRYGVSLGATSALGEATGFQVNDAHAAVQLIWQPSFALGFRTTPELGVSLLTVAPSSDLSAKTATAYGAAFVELGVSRPFSFGAFAFAPELGLRAHLAERRVTVDGAERLLVPYFVPQARLSVIWSGR